MAAGGPPERRQGGGDEGDVFFAKAADRPRDTVGQGIARQLMAWGDDIMAARVWFDAGAVGGLHAHPHAQVSYVESGRFEVTVGRWRRVLSAGDSFYVPPDVSHGAVCLAAGVLIDVFAPHREDFLAQDCLKQGARS